MRLRMEGPASECRRAIDALTGVFAVISITGPFPGNDGMVRYWIELDGRQ